MTTAYSSLMGLALPVQGELSGTWGDTVNNGITNYLDVALAGTQTISGNQTAVTLSLTNGNASATNIAQAGSGATGSAQYAIINCTGNPASLLTITVPASSRQYVVINATSTSQSVKVVGAGPTTGVTIVSGEKAHIVWNGSDFVKIASTSSVSSFSAGTTGLTPNSATTGAVTLAGTLATTNGGTGLTSFTANGVMYASSTSALTTGSALTFDGSGVLTVGSDSVATVLNAPGDVAQYVVDSNGTGATASHQWRYGSTEAMRLTSTGLGIGTSSPGAKLDVSGNAIISDNSSNAALRITQTGAGNALVVEDSANPDSTPFVVTTDGRALIGGTSATAPTPGMTPWLQLQGTTSATSSISGMRFSNDAAQPYYVFAKSRSTTKGTFGTIVQSSDALGTILFNGDDGSSIPIQAASIEVAVDGTPGTNDMPGRLMFSTTADGASSPTERMRIDNAGNVGIGLTPVANNGILQLNSYASVQAMMEKATVSATAATGTINFDAATQPVLYYTTNSSGNWTINIRGSASLSLNSMMATGQSLTLAFLATNGATAYYQSALTIDGSSVTPKWQGGTAPTAGNASSIDAYVLTVIKTGSATFTVLASQTKFA